MLYRFKLTNREDKYVTVDEDSYKFLTEDPAIKGFNVLEHLREHSTSGGAVYQKWFKTPGNALNCTKKPFIYTKQLQRSFCKSQATNIIMWFTLMGIV